MCAATGLSQNQLRARPPCLSISVLPRVTSDYVVAWTAQPPSTYSCGFLQTAKLEHSNGRPSPPVPPHKSCAHLPHSRTQIAANASRHPRVASHRHPPSLSKYPRPGHPSSNFAPRLTRSPPGPKSLRPPSSRAAFLSVRPAAAPRSTPEMIPRIPPARTRTHAAPAARAVYRSEARAAGSGGRARGRGGAGVNTAARCRPRKSLSKTQTSLRGEHGNKIACSSFIIR